MERNWTQADLGRLAGVGQATVQRAEHGASVQMTSMIRLLRALGLLEALDVAIPESIDLPIAQLERERSDRKRARARAEPGRHSRLTDPWAWGDQPGGDA